MFLLASLSNAAARVVDPKGKTPDGQSYIDAAEDPDIKALLRYI